MNNEDGMESSWIHKSVQHDIHHAVIEQIGWLAGVTEWITMKNGKPYVNEIKK